MAARRGFFAPIHEGVFAHRKRIGPAIWEFTLLINWVTKEIPDPSLPGESLGVVLNGKAITIRKIAQALEETTDAAKEHLGRLEREGYILRELESPGGSYIYSVKRSKKWGAKAAGVVDETPRGAGVNAPEGGGQKPLANKEENKINKEEQLSLSSTGSGKASPDTRHKDFTAVVDAYWKRKNPGIREWFTDGFGKNLKQLLKDNPSLTVEMFESWVSNRENSLDVTHSEDPKVWILYVKKYAGGPLNGFGRPITQKGNGNGNGKGLQSVAAKEWTGFESIARAAAGIAADGRADGRGTGDLPQATID